MEIVNDSGKSYILRIDPGEEFRGEVEKFCAEQNIGAAWVNALGSCDDLELAYYNLDKKEYETKSIKERLEIVTVLGNIALKEGKPFLHVHGTFSDPEMKVLGGHINRCVVSATCEVRVLAQEGSMGRKYDDATRLNILCKL